MTVDAFQRWMTSTPMILWSSVCALFIGIEVACGRDVRWRDRALNASNGVLVVVVMTLVGPTIAAVVMAIGAEFGFAARPVVDLPSIIPQPALAALLFLLVQDLAYYWYHRLQHAWTPLWRVHCVHHSDTRLNATSYVRQHVSDNVIHGFVVSAPLYVFMHVNMPTLAWAAFITALVQFFIHTDLPIHYGPFSAVVTSPLQHRVHHSAAPSSSNANFASIFPVWDVLFGTFRHPEPTPATGLHSGEQHDTLRALLLAPFVSPSTGSQGGSVDRK